MVTVTPRPVDELQLIVSAAAVPMAIVDYRPVMRRFAGMSAMDVRLLLASGEELLECLRLPRMLAASAEWLDLYGSPLSAATPDLPSRRFTPERYPKLAQSMIDQMAAPFEGVTSLLREHVAPSMVGEVVVRSHWKASQGGNLEPYSRIVIVDHDVTDLREVQRSLEAAVEGKDRMVATIAHELRNPITSLVGFSSILDSDWDDLDDAGRREMAALTASQAADVAQLLEDIVAAAAGSSVPVEMNPLRLDEVLGGLDFDGITVPEAPRVTVMGDRLRIRQVIRNLVENARRYGGELRTIEFRVGERTVEVEVRDDGQGLASDVAGRLFQPHATSGASGSLGLGLAVSRQLARAMKGDLVFERRDQVTVFRLTLLRVHSRT